MKAKVLQLFDDYRSVQRSKGSDANKGKEEQFVESLSVYFYVAQQDASSQIEGDRLRNKKQKERRMLNFCML